MVIRFCWLKSGVGGNEPQETAAEKARSDQNYKCRGNFARHQKAAEMRWLAPVPV